MPLKSVAYPEQLAILRQVLDSHCATNGIGPDSSERDGLATSIMSLYSLGYTTQLDLNEALARMIQVSGRARIEPASF